MEFRTAAPAGIRIRVRLLAQYAELLGLETTTLELPQGATVSDAVAAIRRGLSGGSAIPQRPLAALNFAHVLPDQPLADGDELALLPPLAGG